MEKMGGEAPATWLVLVGMTDQPGPNYITLWRSGCLPFPPPYTPLALYSLPVSLLLLVEVVGRVLEGLSGGVGHDPSLLRIPAYQPPIEKPTVDWSVLAGCGSGGSPGPVEGLCHLRSDQRLLAVKSHCG